jgi:D-glucosaminate-6-phosphate ammonia-lyase
MPDRRTFLHRLSALPIGGAFLTKTGVAQAAPKTRDYFSELGVRTFINAAGTYTTLTASLMQPEVVAAYEYASKHFVPLLDLHDKVAVRIATLLGAEAAMVTSGAAGALTCGTAACITGTDRKAIQQIPDLTGLKSEVLVQKTHRYGYDHAVRTCGVKLVEVETVEELERSVNERTAMMLFFNANEPLGKIKGPEFVALGKKHKVPTFNDAAADVPPVENLTKYIKMGFDLVTFSGGKGIRGPQSAGLLYGRKDLIEAARLNTSPYSDSISRGQKVNKEEILGMMVAIENYMARDHKAEWKEWERRVKLIADSVAGIKSVTTETWIPEIANAVPHLKVRWDSSVVKLSPQDAMKQLREGKPSIEASPATDKDNLVIAVWMLQPGEAEIVARRLQAVLKG